MLNYISRQRFIARRLEVIHRQAANPAEKIAPALEVVRYRGWKNEAARRLLADYFVKTAGMTFASNMPSDIPALRLTKTDILTVSQPFPWCNLLPPDKNHHRVALILWMGAV